jgi:hypothetical protein
MALTKSSRAVLAGTPVSAGNSLSSLAQPINYGVSGVAVITNGGTAPTLPCGLRLDFSPDGGTTWVTGPFVGYGDTVNSSVTRIPYSLGIGAGGDWTHYRTTFTGHTGQSVTVQADDSTTTAL